MLRTVIWHIFLDDGAKMKNFLISSQLLQLKKECWFDLIRKNAMNRGSRTADWIILTTAYFWQARPPQWWQQQRCRLCCRYVLFCKIQALPPVAALVGESNLSLLLFWKIETPSANILWLCAAANLAKSDIKYECGLVLLTPTNHHQPSHKIFQPRTHTF